MVIGLIIVAVGVIALLVNLDVLSGSVWDYTWPTILVIIGLSFIFGWFRRRRWTRWWWGFSPWEDRSRREDRDKTMKE